ncbi:MAG: Spo0B domain-containing protein [Firmicutes bacterium]|nr:Spo0B domain-containing protein [Bacillota bacterium]
MWRDEDIRLLSAVWRHDAANVLQVVFGWLQMGEPARAAQLLREYIADLAAEGRALHQCPDWLAAALVWTAAAARAEGTVCRLRGGERAPADLPPDAREAVRGLLRACREAAAAAEGETHQLVLSAGLAGADLVCEIWSLTGEGAFRRLAPALASLSGAADVQLEPEAELDGGARGARIRSRWSVIR